MHNSYVIRDYNTWVEDLSEALRNGCEMNVASEQNDRELDEELNLDRAATWHLGRHVPGEAIREVLLRAGPTADPRGLIIRGAYITGKIGLAYLTIGRLGLVRCAVEENIDWTSLSAKQLTLTASHIKGMVLDEVSIEGNARWTGLNARGEVRAMGAAIGGRLYMQCANLVNEGGKALTLNGAEIKGGATFERLDAVGQINIEDATIGGQMDLTDARLSNPRGYALSLDSTEIKGDVFMTTGYREGASAGLAGSGEEVDRWKPLNRGVRVRGEVRAVGAKFNRQLDLKRATFFNASGDALQLSGAEIGQIWLAEMKAEGRVSLAASSVGILSTVNKAGQSEYFQATQFYTAGWHLTDIHGNLRHNRKAVAALLASRPRRAQRQEFVPQPWREVANIRTQRSIR